MQGSLFEPNDLPELAPPDPITHALFEAPALPALGFVVLAVLAALTLRSTGHPTKGLIALGAGVLLAAALFVSASVVTTDREHIQTHARSLIEGVADGDATLMTQRLTPDVIVRTRFVSAEGRDEIVSLAQTRADPAVDEHEVQEIQVELLGPRIARSQIRVRTQGSSLPTLSWWRVDWVRDDLESSQWRASFIEPLWIQGVSRPAG